MNKNYYRWQINALGLLKLAKIPSDKPKQY